MFLKLFYFFCAIMSSSWIDIVGATSINSDAKTTTIRTKKAENGSTSDGLGGTLSMDINNNYTESAGNINEIEVAKLERMLLAFKELFAEDNRHSIEPFKDRRDQLHRESRHDEYRSKSDLHEAQKLRSMEAIESSLIRLPIMLQSWFRDFAVQASKLTVSATLARIVDLKLFIDKLETFLTSNDVAGFLQNPMSTMANYVINLIDNFRPKKRGIRHQQK